MMKKFFLVMGLGVVLTGCTNTMEECDPNVELNIFSKATCKFSGSYDNRVKHKEKLVLDAKEENKKFTAIYENIKAQQQSVNATLKQKQAQQAKLNRSLNALTNELKQKAKGKAGLQAEIAQVEKQLKTVNSSNSSEMEKQAELEKLQRKLTSLQQALGLL